MVVYLKITPCHEFARYAAVKYRFSWLWMEKCTRKFLGRHPRGLLGRRPRTFERRVLKPASHRTSSRSKRNSYICRPVAGKVAKHENARRDEIARSRQSCKFVNSHDASRVNCGFHMFSRAFPESRRSRCSILHSVSMNRGERYSRASAAQGASANIN